MENQISQHHLLNFIIFTLIINSLLIIYVLMYPKICIWTFDSALLTSCLSLQPWRIVWITKLYEDNS